MWKTFIKGLIFGSGAAIAFIVWSVASLYYVFPSVSKDLSNRTVDLSDVREAEVVAPSETRPRDRQFELFKGAVGERTIPEGGGMLSVSVRPQDSGHSRPSTFQAWVTESEAYIVQTEGDVHTVKQMPYREHDAVDYASALVQENFGFVKQNVTFSVDGSEVNSLRNGRQPGRGRLYNGEFRITTEGVVFLLPNEYEHNK